MTIGGVKNDLSSKDITAVMICNAYCVIALWMAYNFCPVSHPSVWYKGCSVINPCNGIQCPMDVFFIIFDTLI